MEPHTNFQSEKAQSLNKNNNNKYINKIIKYFFRYVSANKEDCVWCTRNWKSFLKKKQAESNGPKLFITK